LQNQIKIFSDKVLFAQQAARFKQLLYIYLILRAVFWLFQYDLFFGKHAVVYSSFRGMDNFKDLAFILLNSHSSQLAYYFLFALVSCCLLALYFKKLRILFDITIWITVINLHYKIYSSLTGGDYLINQLLFFNIFLGIKWYASNSNVHFISNIIHNTAAIGIVVQVCLVYFLSGLAKIIDAEWQNGTALSIISKVDQFKLIASPLQNNFGEFILTVLNYLVLLYQVLFPFLVFIKKIKKPVLLFGMLMHLYIIVFMGLLWFGLIMMITYIFFWPIEYKEEKSKS